MNKIITLAGVMAVASVGTIAALVLVSQLGINLIRTELVPSKTITVVGTAKQKESSQVARFSATVTKFGDSKETVNQEMRKVVDALVAAAVEFGIPESNIKTEYFSIFQEEMTNYNSDQPTVRQGPWRGNTNVSFSNVAANQASQFSQLLVSTGASSIDGPSYSLEDASDYTTELTKEALVDARTKAQAWAESQGLKLGEVISISETGYSPIMPLMREMGGGGGGFYGGSQEVSASITVTYSLR